MSEVKQHLKPVLRSSGIDCSSLPCLRNNLLSLSFFFSCIYFLLVFFFLCRCFFSVTLLLSAEPEIKYVALRNIDLIVQKYPAVLENELKVFFCKYNDPIFVKLEKLEIMIKLATARNIDPILLEFKELRLHLFFSILFLVFYPETGEEI